MAKANVAQDSAHCESLVTGDLPDTLRLVAGRVNAKYWEAHALLHACWLITKDLDEDDFPELKVLLGMASGKVLEMQHVVNPYLARKEANHV